MPDSVCPDCKVAVGEKHMAGCDVARCLWTGGQLISCDGGFADIVRQLRADGHEEMASRLAYHLSIEEEEHECGDDVWTGEWPGVSDAKRLGFWCFGPPWVPCSADHPSAVEDLNRLRTHAKWNRNTRRWERRDEGEA